MPIYEYECTRHGTFEQLSKITTASAPARCPNCKRKAPRVLSATQAPALARSTRIAHERNERSQHEPRLVAAPRADPATTSHAARPATHHHHGHAPARPWMIGH